MDGKRHGEALILGVFICAGLALLGYLIAGGVVSFRALDRTVMAKGLAEREVAADVAIWPIRFDLADNDLSHAQTREVVDLIMDRTRDLFDRGMPKEILTVDNHADGPYIYLRLLREDPERAADVLELLRMNEGNNSGRGIGCVSWDGEVYADQFWREISFGNVRERPFSDIWLDTSNELMAKLKDKKSYVTGRCADCRWLDVCGGNFRARAETVTGDIWGSDPACYLTDEEIKGDI